MLSGKFFGTTNRLFVADPPGTIPYAAFLYELWNYDPTKRLSVISRAACCFFLPNILIHILVDMMGVEFAYYMSVPNQRRLKLVGQGVIIGMAALAIGVFLIWIYPE